jgi:urea transporter
MSSDSTHRVAATLDPHHVARVVLRGIGQVMFQEHAGTGLLFLTGIAVASPVLALGALLGAVIGPGVAHLMRLDRSQIEAGIHGFNPTLVGIALPFYLRPDSPLTWALVMLGCAASVPITHLMRTYLRFPTYTLPFIVTAWAVLLLAHATLGHSIDLKPAPPEHTPRGFFTALFSGVAEVMFGANVITGILFLAGIAWSNWRHAVIALLGSLAGTLVGIYHADPKETIELGIYGYNAALAAMAIYLWRRSLQLPILAALISVPLTEFFPKALGIPALTAPFVAAAWIVLATGWLEKKFVAGPTPPAST